MIVYIPRLRGYRIVHFSSSMQPRRNRWSSRNHQRN